jgi:hypothetical protein
LNQRTRKWEGKRSGNHAGSVDGLYQRTRKWEGEGSRNQKMRRFVSENQEVGRVRIRERGNGRGKDQRTRK